jgi:hypothetical protein
MTRIVAFHAALAASCFLASTALADDKQVCSDAYKQAQALASSSASAGAPNAQGSSRKTAQAG